MDSATQHELFDELHAELKQIALSKGADYAGEDVLSNFKQVSLVVKALKIDVTTPVGYASLMTVLKIQRINNILSDKKIPNNESLQDSFKDGINYFRLAYACYMEEQGYGMTTECFPHPTIK